MVAELQTICREYHEHIARLEGDKYDADLAVKIKDYQVTHKVLVSEKTSSPGN